MTKFQPDITVPLHLQIAEHLRRRILSGELPPGARLPNTGELAATYGVTVMTVQKSLRAVAESGLIERTPRRGSFVCDRRQANIVGIIYGWETREPVSPYYGVLLNRLMRRGYELELNMKLYTCFTGIDESRMIYELQQDLNAGRLKALIPARSTSRFGAFRASHAIDVPVLWLTDNLAGARSAATAMRYLYERGYRDIRVVSQYPGDAYCHPDRQAELESCRAAAAACGTVFNPDHLLLWGQCPADGYRRARELFSGPNRPAAILVNHDIMTPGVLLALCELGLKIPRDVALLTHANLGCEITSPVPLTRVVFDPADAVENIYASLLNPEHPEPLPVVPKIQPGESCGEAGKQIREK